MKNYIKSTATLIAILSIFSSCAANSTEGTSTEADDTVFSIDNLTTDSAVSATQEIPVEASTETTLPTDTTESTSNPDSFG